MRRTAHWCEHAGGGPDLEIKPSADHLLAVLEGVDAAVVAVRVGDPQLIANAAARSVYALPDHRQLVVEDLVGAVRIFHAQCSQPMVLDDLPLIRALSGQPAQIEAVVLGPDDPGAGADAGTVLRARRLTLRARPLFGRDQEVTGSVCTAQDVTDLRTEHAALARRAAELDAISRATRAIISDEDARRAVCGVAREVSRAALASLYEPDGSGDLVCTTHLGADLTGTRLSASGASMAATVFTTGRPRAVRGGAHLVADQQALDRVFAGAGERLHAAVWLPVMNRRGRCMAVLSLAFGADVLVSEHLPVLEILAGETAVAIERQDLLRRLRWEATSDGLTGASNRRVWEEELPRGLATARRTGTSVAVVMLDFDHFKQYNDAYGHPAGDSLLRDTVAAWRRRLRTSDVLCRYGGEEFVALLPGCGVGEARALAQQLRAVVPNGQTCSAGVAVWDGEETPEGFVERVDAALYAAKLAGRNRVCVAS